jgi:hypothetical protein
MFYVIVLCDIFYVKLYVQNVKTQGKRGTNAILLFLSKRDLWGPSEKGKGIKGLLTGGIVLGKACRI